MLVLTGEWDEAFVAKHRAIIRYLPFVLPLNVRSNFVVKSEWESACCQSAVFVLLY